MRIKAFRLYSVVIKGILGGTVVKNLPANARAAGGVGSIPGLGRSPEEGNGNPLQYFYLENPMDREAWWAIVHGIARVHSVVKSWPQLSRHACTLKPYDFATSYSGFDGELSKIVVQITGKRLSNNKY